MEGRRSKTKASEVGNVKTHATPKQFTILHLQRESFANIETMKSTVGDRYVPTIGGENKRKRAPRGFVGQNGEAMVENINRKKSIVDSRAKEVFVSYGKGFRQAHRLLNEEDRSRSINYEYSAKSKEQAEKRQGSYRHRVQPSKFREGMPIKSFKIRGELKNNEARIDVQTIDNTYFPNLKDNTMQLVPLQVDTRELIARIFSSKKETKSMTTPFKEKESSKSALVVSQSSNEGGLKSVLLALKQVMKMKEAEFFNKPIDPIKLGIPDYFEIVKRPMDLGTICDWLEKGEVYDRVDNVLEDVALVWNNCRRYYDDNNHIMGPLQNLESTFNKLCPIASSHYCATNNANLKKFKDKQLHEWGDDKVLKKKKVKDVKLDAWVLLKTKIKRSALVDQVMAESKAREQKGKLDGVNVGDKDKAINSTGANASAIVQHVDILRVEQGLGDEDGHGSDQDALQGLEETLLVKSGRSSIPERFNQKFASSQQINLTTKPKRPNGHTTLTHRQGCLCVVCAGRRKRETKLRKSGSHLKAIKFTYKELGGSILGDTIVEEDDLNFLEDVDEVMCEDFDSLQGYTSTNFKLPLQKLDPHILELSTILLGSKPGSIWNRPHSLGYVPVPHLATGVGIAGAISSL